MRLFWYNDKMIRILIPVLMTDLRWDILWRLNPDGGIPLSRWQDGHLVKEFIYPREEICSVFGLVRHVVKYLQSRVEIQCKPELK